MMHLTEDQIYHLVEAIGNHETLTAEEEQQMEHISCLLYTSDAADD